LRFCAGLPRRGGKPQPTRASGALRGHYVARACAAKSLAEKLERLGVPGWLTAGLAKAAELDAHRMLPPPGFPIEILAQVIINSIDAFGCFTAAAAEGCYFQAGEEAYPDGPSLCIPVTMHVPSRWCPQFIVTVTPADLAEEGTDD
jgi:hypothetical protein